MKSWKNELKKLPLETQDIYYIDKYIHLFSSNHDGNPDCYIYQKDNKIAIYPYLVNSVNYLGYELNEEYFDIQGAYGYNGVLSNSTDLKFIDGFYKSFYEYCRKENIIAEFTRFHPLLGNKEFSINNMQVLFDRETIALDLTKDYESIWLNDYSSKNRNMIRKAQKDGHRVEIIESPDNAQIDNFYKIYTYSMKMAEADNYYFFSKTFFSKTFSLLKPNCLLFNILNSDNELVCSSIFFQYGNYFHYHLSGRSEHASNAVNNFLLDEAIKYAIKIGAKIFHFGGGRSSKSNDSLLKFKENFSKTRVPFYIGKKIHNKIIYDEVVRQWEEKYPGKILKYKNHLLKYRYCSD